MRSTLKQKKRLVIKIGSSILTDAEGRLDPLVFQRLAAEAADLQAKGRKVILVSSGAIAAGMKRLGFATKPHLIPQKQAMAAAGQTALMHEYEKAFAVHGLNVAQILLTRDDLADRRRFLNARHAIAELLKWDVIPIINENDTVAFHEIRIGDNDNLSALVTNVAEADLLIILTDIDAVFDADPKLNKDAKRLSVIASIDKSLYKGASDTLRPGSTGGMRTKLEAAEKAADYGVTTVIANGRVAKAVERILDGEDLGTVILPKDGTDRLTAKKHWLAHTLRPVGTLLVDAGAKEALIAKGKSLLPSGVKSVEGDFSQGDPIDVKVEGEAAFARGLSSYSSKELGQIMGRKTGEIEKILGYKYFDEVIHRDDMVLLSDKPK
ncbi:MAG: glutamate 5-kinase [Deltaproteobacteria bacterium]|nr:glutamate 5-kinase [Deltaproteobacteria bacterium]